MKALNDSMSDHSFAAFAQEARRRVEDALEALLPGEGILPARLHQAMRYSVLGGGKRIRPLLAYATAHAIGVPLSHMDRPAAAVELIHAYSLVHDDLPAMDDDDMRRGRPTCHRRYDEPTAILVGDGLQALAFHVLAEGDWGPGAALRLRMVETLAKAAGSRGMVGGQAIDLAAVGHELALPALEAMHLHKTGMLIRAAVEMGLLAADIRDGPRFDALTRYADRVGLAFQVQDDILDEIGDLQKTGKARQGADRERSKPGFVTALGLSAAQDYARALLDESLALLTPWGREADYLRELARLVVERNQ